MPDSISADSLYPSAAPASQGGLDPDTTARAMAVYNGLTKRGMDQDTALGFAASAVGESQANPYSQPGDNGAAMGAFMWRGSRLAAYRDRNGHDPQDGDLDEQLDHVMWENRGPEANAYRDVLLTPGGPEAKAAAVSRYWERPQDVELNADHRSWIARQLIPSVLAAEPTPPPGARSIAADDLYKAHPKSIPADSIYGDHQAAAKPAAPLPLAPTAPAAPTEKTTPGLLSRIGQALNVPAPPPTAEEQEAMLLSGKLGGAPVGPAAVPTVYPEPGPVGVRPPPATDEQQSMRLSGELGGAPVGASEPAAATPPTNLGERLYQGLATTPPIGAWATPEAPAAIKAALQAWNDRGSILTPYGEQWLKDKGFSDKTVAVINSPSYVFGLLNAAWSGGIAGVHAALEPVIGKEAADTLASMPEAFPLAGHELGGLSGAPRVARLTPAEAAAMRQAQDFSHPFLGGDERVTPEAAAGRAERESREAWQADMEQRTAAGTPSGTPLALPAPARPRIRTPEAMAMEEEQEGSAPAAPGVTPSTPEPTSDIAAQINAMADPKNPKDSVFIAAGNDGEIPSRLPEGTLVAHHDAGTFLTTNPDKLRAFNEGPVTDALLARLLGYPQTKDEAIASGAPVVVQGKDKDGNVVSSTLASPEGVPAAEQAIGAQTPEGGHTEVVPPTQAQDERRAKAAGWSEIGKNYEGDVLYEAPDGARSILKDGARLTDVETRPVRMPNGSVSYQAVIKAPANRMPRYQVAEWHPSLMVGRTPEYVAPPVPSPEQPPPAVPPVAPPSGSPPPVTMANPTQVDPDHEFASILANGLENPDYKVTARELQALGDRMFGGQLANNDYSRDRLYDAIELGVNRYIQNHPERFAPTGDADHAKAVAAELAALKERIPTQTVRGGEKESHQQFSTPPDYSYAAAWVANLQPTDRVLEPSAGTGSLMVHALNAGVSDTHANELSEKRRSMLGALGIGTITGEDASQLHNILPPTVKPTAVIMNPPFSAAPRMGDKMVIMEGARHVEQALSRLEPGGRLVAIVGRGMAPDTATFKEWWNKIEARYDVRANLGVEGGIYRKYGTTFPTRLLVIDKVPPSGRPKVTGNVKSADEIIEALKGIRDERPALNGRPVQPVANQPSGGGVAPQGGGNGPAGGQLPGTTGSVGPGAGPTVPATQGGEPANTGGSGDTGGIPSGGGAGASGTGNPLATPGSGQQPGGTNLGPGQAPGTGGNVSGGGTGGVGGGLGQNAGPTSPSTGVKPPPGELPPDFGADNTLFTKDGAEEGIRKLQELLNRLNAGFDPEMMAAGLRVAGYYIEGGLRKFADFARQMIKTLGEKIRPYLAHFYNSVRDFPGFDRAGMDGAAAVEDLAKDPNLGETPVEKPPDELTISTEGSVTDPNNKEITDSVYEPYTPERVKIEGAQPHPTQLVQSAAMASVSPPDVSYRPRIAKQLITSGALSDAQLEAIVYAGNAHNQMLPASPGEVTRRRGFFIGDGCVAAGTRIFNPETGEYNAIEVLAAAGKPHTVLALTDDGFVPARAAITFKKGVADLYRVVMDDDREITVTAHHRFLTPDGWMTIDQGLAAGSLLAGAEGPQGVGTNKFSTHAEDARSCKRTPQDCLGRCSSDHHPYGERLPREIESGQVSVPSPTDADERTLVWSHADDLAPSRAHNPLFPSVCHQSRRSSSPLVSRGHALSGARGSGVLVPPLVGKHRAFSRFPLETGRRRYATELGWPHQTVRASCSFRIGTWLSHRVCEVGTTPSEKSHRTWWQGWSYERQRYIPRRSYRTSILKGAHSPFSQTYFSGWHKVISINFIRRDEFFDMFVPGPENYVAEGLVNHNTGVGKGREIAGIILDNWNQGRKKAVWISETTKLVNDARRDWSGVGGDPGQIISHGKVKTGVPIKGNEGILFSTYTTAGKGFGDQNSNRGYTKGSKVRIAQGTSGITGATTGKVTSTKNDPDGTLRVTAKMDDGGTQSLPYHWFDITERAPSAGSRLDQIVNWVGKDFDGVIAFDESHNMANAMPIRGTRGKSTPAAKALAGVELQRRLPNARVVYVSATGATEVTNLAYADRLGLWGRGTPFPTRDDFLSKIQTGGIAGMELIARDMKALGHYIARNLSYDGVDYDRIQHNLTTDQKETYDKLAEGWQVVLQNFNQALVDTNSPRSVRTAMLAQFWGTHQRFFNQIITSMQMPTVITAVEQDLKEGKQAVLQLVNTMEAAQTRAVERAREAGEDFEDLDMTPRDQLLQMVERAYPIHQWEDSVNSDGDPIKVQAIDSEGNAVINQDAVAARDQLLTELASLRVPDGPLEILLNSFGADQVAEVTGRSQRAVRMPDENGQTKTVLQTRGADANISEANDFQAGRKKILVFSQAGGTGRSYHDEKGINRHGVGGNSARRSHYLVQAGWTASKAVQGFGRTHRTNQWTAPIFHLVTTDLDGQKRFISSIARRLGQLGALTKGERRTGDQGLFGMKDNLESPEAHTALNVFIHDVIEGKIPNLTLDEFQQATGLQIVGPNGAIQVPEMTQFLNRLLSFKFDEQNRVFSAFGERLDTIIDLAAAAGTLDTGTETYRADRIIKNADNVVYRDPQSGAETRHVQLSAQHANHPAPFAEVQAGHHMTGGNVPLTYVRNKQSGRLYALTNATSYTDKNGAIIDQYRLTSPLDYRFIDRQKTTGANWERVHDLSQAEDIWNQQVASTPPYRSTELHLITGAVLPIWDRLRGNPRIFRLQTSDGERMLGRVIPNDQVDATLERLGAERAEVAATPEQVASRVLAGATAEMSNGWKIKRSLVAGQQRLELTGPHYSYDAQLKADGVFTEKIGYQVRYFIPAGADAGAVIERITQGRPVTRFLGGDEAQFARAPVGEPQAEHGAPVQRGWSEVEGRDMPSPEATQAMVDAVQMMVGPEVRVEVVNTHGGGLTITRRDGTQDHALGFAIGRLIRIALDPEDTARVLNHEAIHALRNLGAFTPAEWATLEDAARRGDWAAEHSVPARYPHLPEEKQTEEAIAEEFAHVMANPNGATPFMARLAMKLRNWLNRLRNFLAGRGFRTADDVFGSVSRGEVGAREPGTGMAERGPNTIAGSQYAASLFQPDMRFARRPVAQRPPSAPFDTVKHKNPLVQAGREIKSWLAPTSIRGAAGMSRMLHRHGAELAQSMGQAIHRLEQGRDALDKMGRADQLEFFDRMEEQEPQLTPDLDMIASTLRDTLDEWATKIQSLGRGYLENAIDGYMGRVYSNHQEWSQRQPPPPQSVVDARAQAAMHAKRPLTGSGAFLKQRKFETLREAMAAGLIPVTHNPIDMQLMKIREFAKFYHGTVLADKMKDAGIARWVRKGQEHTATVQGWQPLDDRVFRPRLSGSQHGAFGLIEAGNWYAPEPAARLFNNYMSRGLAGNSIIYDAIRVANAALNSLQLAFSGFHATFVMNDMMTSQAALGLHQILGGQFGKGLVSIGLAPTPYSIYRTLKEGSKLRSTWLDPAGASPEWRHLAEMLNSGGGRGSMEQIYRTNASGSFFRHFADLKHPQSVLWQVAQMFSDEPAYWRKAMMVPLRIIGRTLDTFMEPLMGHLVPRAKLGVFAQLARMWEEQNPMPTRPPGSSTPIDLDWEARRDDEMIKIWNSVDNRLGLMTYDNIFWKKTGKDLAFIGGRSVGWNLGTVREIGGGAFDTAKMLTDAARGKRPQFTYRQSYSMMMPLITALIGAMLTYWFTGRGPQADEHDLGGTIPLDYFYPPTSRDVNGVQERLNIPGYTKDTIAFYHDPKGTFINKLAPALSEVGQIINNRDYYNGIIYDRDKDNIAAAYFDYLFNANIPFSVRARLKMSADGDSPEQQALSFFGFQPAPNSVVAPERGEMYEMRQENMALRRRNRESGQIHIFMPNPAAAPTSP